MIQEIGERSGGFWRPSPGSVYPTLQLLTDEGLISTEGGSAGKRLFELTDEGRELAAKQDSPPWTQITQDADPVEIELRTAMGHLASALSQVSQAATSAQKARAVTLLNETRRAVYAILGSTDDES
jgi:DNA-binding PadR family transcriptional regulator